MDAFLISEADHSQGSIRDLERVVAKLKGGQMDHEFDGKPLPALIIDLVEPFIRTSTVWDSANSCEMDKVYLSKATKVLITF